MTNESHAREHSARSHQPAAPPVQRIAAHARLEARSLLGNGEQLMVALVLPALVFLGLSRIRVPGLASTENQVLYAVAATAATAVIATSMTSQAIATGFDRRAGVLRWIATTALGRGGYMMGKIAALGIIHLLQVLVLGSLAFAHGWRPAFTELAIALPVWVLGALVFGAAGLAMAGTLRAEAVLALSNIAFILLVALGGIALPISVLPPWLQPVASILPSAALMDALLASVHARIPSAASLTILVVWAAVFSVITVKFFKWTSN